MLQRSPDIAFMGGGWVFPGGGVDRPDCLPGVAPEGEETGRVTAVRETAEEAGVRLSTQDLFCIAHWTAPESAPRRYATWFYLAELPDGEVVRVDGTEIVAHRWIAPQHALRERALGKMDFLPPTFVSLEWLSTHDDARGALQYYREREPQIFGPKILMDGDDVCNIYAEDVAYDTDDVQAPGPRHRFRMGKHEWSYECNY